SGGSLSVAGQLNMGFTDVQNGSIPAGTTSGSVTQSGTSNVSIGEDLNIGRGGGNASQGADPTKIGVATYNMNGGTLLVGRNATDATRFAIVVGADPNTRGVVNQTGGSVTSNRWAFVGRAQGTGTYNQSGGTMQTAGWVRIGEGAGTGTYALSGTAVLQAGGKIGRASCRERV